jgi:hypothetical protein
MVKANQDTLDWQARVGTLLTHTLVGGMPLFVAGGSATDTLMGYQCKDFDVFMPESQYRLFNAGEFIRSLTNEGAENLEFEEETFGTKYGTNTLRHRFKLTVLGRPAVIEIISVDNDVDIRNYREPSEWESSARNLILRSFGANSSWSFFSWNKGRLPVISSCFVRSSGYLPVIRVREGCDKLFTKCLMKYSGFVSDISVGTSKDLDSAYRLFSPNMFLLTEHGFIPIKEAGVLRIEERNSSRDTKNPLAETEESVPSVRWVDPVGAGGIGSRPFVRASAGSPPQELQSTRGEIQWFTETPTVAFVNNRIIPQTVAAMERPEPPQFSAPRPRDPF